MWTPNRWVILAEMLLIVLILGMVLDTTPIIIITLPIFIPVVRQLGFDPLWFCLVYTMDLIIGMLTPPYGIVMFYFYGLRYEGVTMADIYKACLPFVAIMAFAWILCILFPPIAIWLPRTMIK